MRIPAIFLLTALCLCCLAASDTAFGAETVLVDGIPHIRNGSEPSGGVQDLHLDEIWRVGGDEDEVFFGAAVRAIADDDGNIYVMDNQLSEVSVLSPDGEYLRTLGGEGDGPGELRGPSDIFFLSDGRLAVLQTFPGRVITLNTDGTPGPSFTFDAGDGTEANFGVLLAGRCRGGSFVLNGFNMRIEGPMNTQRFFVARCDESGKQQHRFYEKDYAISYADFVIDEGGIDFVGGRMDIGPDGLLYAAPDPHAYAIEVRGPDGTLLRVIEREYQSYTRSAAEKRVARDFTEAWGRIHPIPPRDVVVEDVDDDIAGLWVTDSGEIWVSTSQGANNIPDDVVARFDVFDGAGEFVRQVDLRGDVNLDADVLQPVSAQRFVALAGAGASYLNKMGVQSEGTEGTEASADEAIMEVVCYAVR